MRVLILIRCPSLSFYDSPLFYLLHLVEFLWQSLFLLAVPLRVFMTVLFLSCPSPWFIFAAPNWVFMAALILFSCAFSSLNSYNLPLLGCLWQSLLVLAATPRVSMRVFILNCRSSGFITVFILNCPSSGFITVFILIRCHSSVFYDSLNSY